MTLHPDQQEFSSKEGPGSQQASRPLGINASKQVWSKDVAVLKLLPVAHHSQVTLAVIHRSPSLTIATGGTEQTGLKPGNGREYMHS